MVFNRLFKTTAFRLSAIYLIIIILASVVVGSYISWKINNLITNQLVETISVEVKGLAEQYRDGGTARMANIIASRSSRPGNSLYFFGSKKGGKIAGNLNRIPKALQGGAHGAQFSYVWQQDRGSVTRHAVGIPFPVAGGLVLIVGRDIEDQRSFVFAVRQSFFIGLALLAMFGLGAGLWVSQNLLNRISSISKTSKSIMAGDLSERIQLNGSDDELDRLSANLNTMLERIENLMIGMRQVSDNIAHDLKTPINRIRIAAEEALLDPRGEGARIKALHSIIEEADNLVKTFNALLKIARLEAGADSEQKDIVDLSTMVREVADLFEPVADEQGMSLKINTSECATILADRQLVAQALSNLIDNAIKYTRQQNELGEETTKNTVIELTVRTNENKVELEVSDNGVGIADIHRSRVFDRFVRLEDSRSKPGSGLGLSMVAAITKAYRGTIQLKDNNPGLKAILSFPLYKETKPA